MLTDRSRLFRLLGDRSLALFWLARVADRTADWLVLLTVLVVFWNRTQDASLAAAAAAIWFGARLLVAVLLGSWTRRLVPAAWPLLIAIRALTLLVLLLAFSLRVLADPELLLGGVAALGLLSAGAAAPRAAALVARVGLSDLGPAAMADAFLDRAALFAGSVAAGLLLTTTEPVYSFGAAVIALVVAAIAAFAQTRSLRTEPHNRTSPNGLDAIQPQPIARRTAVYLVGALTAGALGAALLIATLPLSLPDAYGPIEFFGASSAPFLAAAYGLGLMIGPLPVARLLLRVGPSLLLLAAVVVASAVAIAIVVVKLAIIALLLLILLGLVMATQDSLRAVAIRRLVPPAQFERFTRLSLLALTAGQLVGAGGVVLAFSLDPYAALVVVAVTQVALAGLGIALVGASSLKVGGLSALPVKSVVHRLSWDTRPAAKPQDFERAAPRAQRLARWINRQVQLQELQVTLPISKREYVIYRPDDASRDRLFELGRADPEKQMPYWAKVWPSGVALADVVVERKEEVADQHVLELGAGLGVTACAVLEFGGHVVTADYSALPLAHCRLNTLINTDRAPRATCFNWRHDPEVAATMAQPEFSDGFPLIIAGDVLYEGRDAEPLLNVIEQMLVADGSLWLAEPVRRTAQRFLDSAASLGWQIESRQVKAEWPDATDGPVNLHFLKRSTAADQVSADLGGWRI